MFRFAIYIFILLLPLLSYAKEKICLNMIVKNESQVIQRCLESVKPLIDYWVIVDTGSTDGTQEIISEFMKDIPGELHERPWVNFAHNRNEALELAKDKSDYMLFIDADDVLKYSDSFSKPTLDKDHYHLTIHYSGTTYARTQLVKSSLDWKWVGVVHEVVICPEAVTMDVLANVSMEIVGGGDRSQDTQKFLKDALLLEKEVKNNPKETRTVFYLAQSYRDGDMLEKAIATYQKRVDMGGWDQEVFWSLYQIGLLNEALGKSEEKIAKSYSDAFVYRPARAEPLYRLSNYYRRQGNYLLGYLTANFGLTIEPPEDLLFLESWIYDYGLRLESSICAYWLGHYEEALEESHELLSQIDLPLNVRECVTNNIGFSESRLAERARFMNPPPLDHTHEACSGEFEH